MFSSRYSGVNLIIMIIIIGKTVFFLTTAFLRRFCQIASSFNFLFRDFFSRARPSVLRPTPNLEDQVSVFMSHIDTAAQLYPQAVSFLFVTFYDSQGDGGGILTGLHTG
jgi:hypothetical protein